MEMAPQSAVRSGERWHLHGRTRKRQEELRGSRFPTSSALVPVCSSLGSLSVAERVLSHRASVRPPGRLPVLGSPGGGVLGAVTDTKALAKQCATFPGITSRDLTYF